METEYITEFIMIAKLRSFSLAAEELSMSQSSLSKHLKSLETQLGAPLFDRTTRSVLLTPFGQDILLSCEEIAQSSSKIRKLANNRATLNRNHLLLTSIPVMAQYNITGTITNFLKANPDIHLTFSENEPVVMNKMMKEGGYELSFTRISDKENIELESIPYQKDNLVVVLPKDHQFSKRKIIHIKELISESFIFLDKDTFLYDHLVDLCKKNGFIPNVVQTAYRPENIIDLVSKGMGISLLYRKLFDYVNNPNTVAVEVSPLHSSTIGLSKLKSHKLSYAANAFWEYIKDNNKNI